MIVNVGDNLLIISLEFGLCIVGELVFYFVVYWNIVVVLKYDEFF